MVVRQRQCNVKVTVNITGKQAQNSICINGQPYAQFAALQ